MQEIEEIYKLSLKNLLEEILLTKFNQKESKNIYTDKNINDFSIIFELNYKNNVFKILYALDKKLIINLMKVFIDKLESFDISNDLILSIINEFNLYLAKKNFLDNNIILQNKKNNKDINYSFSKMEIIKGYDNFIPFGKLNISIYPLYSIKGDFILGFINSEISISKEEKIFINKKSKENILSTVELLEIKKSIISSINEIKDLKGDNDFLIRKAKALSELSRTWLEINKENL